MQRTRKLRIEEVETADKVLRAMIADQREDIVMLGSTNRFFKDQLDAMYKVQSRLVGILEDKRISRGVILD